MPIYMKVDGITGMGTGPHKGWIVLESCQLGVHRMSTSTTGAGANREASAPSVSEIVVTKKTDVASTALFRESLSGTGKKVQIDFVKDGDKAEVPYMTIILENTMVSGFNVGHGGGVEKRPVESLSLNFTGISYATTPTAPSKDPAHVKDKAMWDLATGRGA
jgi:type VI secretion system secreted protein Hcp